MQLKQDSFLGINLRPFRPLPSNPFVIDREMEKANTETAAYLDAQLRKALGLPVREESNIHA